MQHRIKLTKAKPTSDIPRKQLVEHVKELKELSTERAHYVKARTKLTNQMKAIARSNFLKKEFRKPVSDKELYDLIKGFISDGASGMGIIPLEFARDQISQNIKLVEKRMKVVVNQLPIWTDWGVNIAGVGEITIANIIGNSVCNSEIDPITRESYEKKFITIGDYSNPAKLWKRWGVGIVEGERQKRIKAKIEEKLRFKDTKKASGDQLKAIIHGYNPTRRAILWNVGEGFVKQGKYYRRRYDQEKEKQLSLHPEVFLDKWGKKRPKNNALARAHNRAMRYSTKLFLTDLWNKWREFHGEGEFHKASSERD
jgi:hypothetical protein